MDITLQVERVGDWDHVRYLGPINEDSEVHLAPLLEHLGPNVIFNFSKVEYVNSCGVRAWITFLREMEKNRNVIFEECTPEIVGQINMIPNFKGSSHIRSVYASYSCTHCDFQKWFLFEEGRNMPTADLSSGIAEVKCDKCKNTMEMDELEDEFFSWLEAG